MPTPSAGLARDGDNPYLLVVAGQVHAARQEYADGQAAYDRALESAPDLVAAWSGRAELACELGDFDAAIADLDRAVALQPDDAVAPVQPGLRLPEGGSWAAALSRIWRWPPRWPPMTRTLPPPAPSAGCT